MNAYETQRLANIKRNQALIKELGIQRHADPQNSSSKPALKKRKLDDISSKPTRISARIAAIPAAPAVIEYSSDEDSGSRRRSKSKKSASRSSAKIIKTAPAVATTNPLPDAEIASIREGWTDWKPVARAPSRDKLTGRFYFESYPSFTPNVSPEEMLRQGVFGGSYFRPLYSRRLGTTVENDWRELPASWIEGLDVEKTLTSPEYDPEVNKNGVSCGQSIEEWEAAGWISHRDDVRGWFQWYCRFFQGRRCDDDDRQVSRWKKCVGETGRWRRLLLKKYASLGVTKVESGRNMEVSPVMHQTCLHWALQITQADLNEFLETGR